MNIENAVRKGRNEIRGKEPHVASEANEVHCMFVEDSNDLAVVGFALETFRSDGARRDAARFGTVETRSAFAIGDYDRDFGVRNAASHHTFGEGLEIRAAAAQEHAN